jgi:hypothetical protein
MRRRLAWMAIFKFLDNNMERIFSFAFEKHWPGWQFFKVFITIGSIFLVLQEKTIGLDGKNFTYLMVIWNVF